jgi:predicted peptidase
MKYLIILSLLISCWLQVFSQSFEAELHRVTFTSSVDDLERDYFLYLPNGYHDDTEQSWPVMMFLHGNGERGNGKDELDYVMIHGPLYEAWIQKRDLPFIMIVPQLPMFGRDTMGLGYIDNRTRNQIPVRLEDGTPPRDLEGQPDYPIGPMIPADSFPLVTLPAGWDWIEEDLLSMLDHVNDNYRTDLNRIYLTGLSYGGFGTWYMASKHPDLFAAICPVVGWGHPSLMPRIAEAAIPVWVFAGGRDPVVQPRYFFEGVNKLESLGHHNVRFTIEADMTHDVWRRVYGGQDIYDWLLSHRKE